MHFEENVSSCEGLRTPAMKTQPQAPPAGVGNPPENEPARGLAPYGAADAVGTWAERGLALTETDENQGAETV